MYNKAVSGRVWGNAAPNKAVLSGFLIFLVLFTSVSAGAKTQGHPFSQIYYIDRNLNMSGFNITNVSYLGIGQVSPAYPLDVAGSERITNNLYIGGNVGIGTTAPTNALTVIGDINATGIIYGILGTQNAVNTTNIVDSAVTDAKISEMNWSKLQNYPSGCPAGYAVQAVNDTLTCVSLSIYGNITGVGAADYVPLWNTTSTLGISVIYQNGGNIGIGTLTPQGKLNVIGDINATGTLYGTLAAGSVGTASIQDGAITSAKIASDLNLSWKNLTGYPASCGAGNAIQAINDTLTCVSLTATGGNISGDGIANYLAKFSDTNLIAASVIYDNGTYIGIGTATPQNPLNVIGDINATGYVYGITGLCIGTDCRTSWPAGGGSSGPWDNDTVQIFVRNGYPLVVNISNVMFVNGTSGRVGIGILNPAYKLDVSGGEFRVGSLYTSSTGGELYVPIVFANTLRAQSSADLNIDVSTAGRNILINPNNGNVGIGTASPAVKLSVNGSMRIDNASGSALLFVNSTAGNVGVGTASPQNTFEVSGTFNATSGNGGLLLNSQGDVKVGV